MAKFFISSTSTDLTDYRSAAIHALHKLGQDVIDMATFTATDANAVEKCLREVDASDVYLGIFAWRYGFVPTALNPTGNPVNPDGLSITEMEYKRAIAKGKRILIFMLADDAPWPRPFMEKGDAADKIEALREFFKNTYVVGFFHTPDDLAKEVSPASVPVIRDIEQALAEAAATAQVATAVAVRAAPPRPTINIAVTPFVGREVELAGWTALLMGETRLVTVVGPGGIGKSRIAIEIATKVQDRFADGACFVSVESAKSGDEMVNLIAEKLKLNLAPQPTVREQLWDFHRDREILIVIDNLESVPLTESGPVISGLLNAGKGVKCLVTSQIRTGLQPERVVELDSMNPDDGREFFRDRARSCVESFELNSQTIKYVDSICTTLEGVPLAIELAASLVTYMGPREILAKVKDVLRVLVADPGTKPGRHLALRAAIEYSYQKLSDRAQQLLPQLSVFKGGFTAEAVEAVSGADAAMAPLGELRNHSLLRRMTFQRSEIVRLGMLESIRQFGAEKLTDLNAPRRHAEYYAGFFTERSSKLRTVEEPEALSEMEAEFGNARAALSWSQEHAAEICSRLALAYQQALYYRGLWDDALSVIEAGLAAAKTLGEPGRQVSALLEYKMASMLHDYGRLPDAMRHAELSLDRLRDIPDSAGRASAFNLIGLIHSDAGDLNAAEENLRKALELWPLKAHGERGKSLNNLARLVAMNGSLAEARGLYADCLRERKMAGDRRGAALTMGNLGALEQDQGNLEEAERLYLESLAIRRDIQEPYGIAIMLSNLGEIAAKRGDDRRALALLVHAERQLTELGASAAQNSTDEIEEIKKRLGSAAFYELRQAVESEPWEPLVEPSV